MPIRSTPSGYTLDRSAEASFRRLSLHDPPTLSAAAPEMGKPKQIEARFLLRATMRRPAERNQAGLLGVNSEAEPTQSLR
jgi:hypothetical protein